MNIFPLLILCKWNPTVSRTSNAILIDRFERQTLQLWMQFNCLCFKELILFNFISTDDVYRSQNEFNHNRKTNKTALATDLAISMSVWDKDYLTGFGGFFFFSHIRSHYLHAVEYASIHVKIWRMYATELIRTVISPLHTWYFARSQEQKVWEWKMVSAALKKIVDCEESFFLLSPLKPKFRIKKYPHTKKTPPNSNMMDCGAWDGCLTLLSFNPGQAWTKTAKFAYTIYYTISIISPPPIWKFMPPFEQANIYSRVSLLLLLFLTLLFLSLAIFRWRLLSYALQLCMYNIYSSIYAHHITPRKHIQNYTRPNHTRFFII